MARRKSDMYIQRAHLIARIAEGEATHLSVKLRKAHEKVKSLINQDKWFESQKMMNDLIAKVTAILNEAYGKQIVTAEKMSGQVVSKEIVWNAAALTKIVESDVLKPQLTKAIDSAWKTKYQGKTFTTWMKRAGVKDVRSTVKAIKAGFINGTPTAEIVSQLAGNHKGRLSDVKSVVRSALMSASAKAKQDVFDENPDFVLGKIWRSTLDTRTTAGICGLRDGLEYTMDNKPVGHSIPWGAGPGDIHFNCRSTWEPKTRHSGIGRERPAISAGENYKRGDNKTSTGKVRKPGRASVEDGIFDIERRTTKTTYEGWLRSQPVDYVADALNSKKAAKRFKDGEALSSVTSKPEGKSKRIDAI